MNTKENKGKKANKDKKQASAKTKEDGKKRTKSSKRSKSKDPSASRASKSGKKKDRTAKKRGDKSRDGTGAPSEGKPVSKKSKPPQQKAASKKDAPSSHKTSKSSKSRRKGGKGSSVKRKSVFSKLYRKLRGSKSKAKKSKRKPSSKSGKASESSKLTPTASLTQPVGTSDVKQPPPEDLASSSKVPDHKESAPEDKDLKQKASEPTMPDQKAPEAKIPEDKMPDGKTVKPVEVSEPSNASVQEVKASSKDAGVVDAPEQTGKPQGQKSPNALKEPIEKVDQKDPALAPAPKQGDEKLPETSGEPAPVQQDKPATSPPVKTAALEAVQSDNRAPSVVEAGPIDGQQQQSSKPREEVIQPERLPIKDENWPDTAASTNFTCPEAMEARIKDGIVHSPCQECEIPECSLFTFVKNNMEPYGEKIALIDGKKRQSFRDVLSMCGRFAEGFRRHGVHIGDSVLALIPNTVDALIGAWALIFSGITVVFPNTQRTDGELQHQIEDCGATYVLTDSTRLNTVRNIDKHGKIRVVFLTDRADGCVSILDFSDLPCADLEALPLGDTREAVAAIGYTSGSTGAPKGVVLTQYSIVASICTFRATECLDDKDVSFIPGHLSLISSSRTALTYLCLGATTVIGQPEQSMDWLISAFNQHKVSIVIGTPQLLHQLANCAHRNGTAVPSLRKVASVGYCLPASTRDAVQRAFTLTWLRPGYGLTEACGIVAAFIDGNFSSNVLGYPGPMVQMKVLDLESNERLPPRRPGEIVIRIPSMMKGYLNKPTETAETIDKEGWLRTARFPAHMHLHGGVVFLGQMPRAASGKVDKRLLREICAAASTGSKTDWPVISFCATVAE
ncbi:uncharacterized protein [Dermacentor albipictus]|uniref:uncharacterized protein isoform X2 n=1 Tax=Dermacentor albipictus TaxID=60249 RepID=UPI0031FBF4B0